METVTKRGTRADVATSHDVKSLVRRALPVVKEAPTHAVSALFPDVVRDLDEKSRAERVRAGADTVLLAAAEGTTTTRGFVRVAMRVPVGDPNGQLYGVFVEVDKDAYRALQRAFREKAAVRVWGTLANRLPLLEDAFGTRVEIVEDGSDLRARVVTAEHVLLTKGPVVGPR